VDPDLVVIGIVVTSCVLGLPIVKAVVRRFEGKGPGSLTGVDDRLRIEVEDLRARLDAIELVDHRLTDVEERLDFAERVLTQRKHNQLSEGS
jgi:hypothetical protein